MAELSTLVFMRRTRSLGRLHIPPRQPQNSFRHGAVLLPPQQQDTPCRSVYVPGFDPRPRGLRHTGLGGCEPAHPPANFGVGAHHLIRGDPTNMLSPPFWDRLVSRSQPTRKPRWCTYRLRRKRQEDSEAKWARLTKKILRLFKARRQWGCLCVERPSPRSQHKCLPDLVRGLGQGLLSKVILGTFCRSSRDCSCRKNRNEGLGCDGDALLYYVPL
jgi:hypothetical protein